ncbi:chaplin [Streptomyces sp. NPDC088116]|uniref:chaplin n=1 Tax=Streptomyces sp. NPDC088116 TaxID=3365825 RepID=UPI00381D9F71
MSRIAKATAVLVGTGAVLAGGAGMAAADAGAGAAAIGSPGVLSGNVVQVPVHIPVNVCGNSINVVGLLNPSFGNTCANVSAPHVKADHHKGGHHKADHHKGGYGN